MADPDPSVCADAEPAPRPGLPVIAAVARYDRVARRAGPGGSVPPQRLYTWDAMVAMRPMRLAGLHVVSDGEAEAPGHEEDEKTAVRKLHEAAPLLGAVLAAGQGHIVLAGGAVARACSNLPFAGVRTPVRPKDYDFFFWGKRRPAEAALRRALAVFPAGATVVRSAHAITVTHKKQLYQFILRLYLTPDQVIAGFDLPASAVLYTPQLGVVFTLAGAFAARHRLNYLEPARRSPNYELRAQKYARLGFSVVVPLAATPAALGAAAAPEDKEGGVDQPDGGPSVADHTAALRLGSLVVEARKPAPSAPSEDKKDGEEQSDGDSNGADLAVTLRFRLGGLVVEACKPVPSVAPRRPSPGCGWCETSRKTWLGPCGCRSLGLPKLEAYAHSGPSPATLGACASYYRLRRYRPSQAPVDTAPADQDYGTGLRYGPAGVASPGQTAGGYSREHSNLRALLRGRPDLVVAREGVGLFPPESELRRLYDAASMLRRRKTWDRWFAGAPLGRFKRARRRLDCYEAAGELAAAEMRTTLGDAVWESDRDGSLSRAARTCAMVAWTRDCPELGDEAAAACAEQLAATQLAIAEFMASPRAAALRGDYVWATVNPGGQGRMLTGSVEPGRQALPLSDLYGDLPGLDFSVAFPATVALLGAWSPARDGRRVPAPVLALVEDWLGHFGVSGVRALLGLP